MQQLSLFDFGEEAPKPEKKKKAPKNGLEQSASSKEKDNIPESTAEKSEPVQEEPISSVEGTTAVPTPPEQPAVPTEESAESINASDTAPATDTDIEESSLIPPINEQNKEPDAITELIDQPETNPAETDETSLDDIKAPLENIDPIPQVSSLEEPADQEASSLNDINGDNDDVELAPASSAIQEHNLPTDPQQELQEQQQSQQVDAPQAEPTGIRANNSPSPEEPIEASTPDNGKEIPAAPTGLVEAEAETDAVPVANLATQTDQTAIPEEPEAQEQENKQPNNDVIFANDQFGVKVVLKSVKTDSIASSPETIKADQQVPEINGQAPEATEEAQTIPSESRPEMKAEDLDTSFSPDDFGGQENQDEEHGNSIQTEPAIAQNIIQEDQAPPVENKEPVTRQDSPSLPTPPKVIEKEASAQVNTTEPDHSEQIIEDSTAPGKENASENNKKEAENQTFESDNKGKKPFYVEDQTVPVRKRGRKSFKEIDAEVDLINIPSDEDLFQKQYYPISVVAKWFRVNNSLLRFWENEFKILKPRKNKKGDRFFRPEDVKNLQLIYYLLRQKKLTINGAIKHLNSYKEQTEVNMQLIQTLNEFKGFLLELRAATEK